MRLASRQQQCQPAWQHLPWDLGCVPAAWESLCAPLLARSACPSQRQSQAHDAGGSGATGAHKGSTIWQRKAKSGKRCI